MGFLGFFLNLTFVVPYHQGLFQAFSRNKYFGFNLGGISALASSHAKSALLKVTAKGFYVS